MIRQKRLQKSMQKIKPQHGFAMPMVLIFLLISSIMSVTLVTRFSGTGSKELTQAKTFNKKYSNAYAGVERIRYELARPDSPSLAHEWSANTSSTYSFTLNGENITVVAENILWDD